MEYSGRFDTDLDRLNEEGRYRTFIDIGWHIFFFKQKTAYEIGQ